VTAWGRSYSGDLGLYPGPFGDCLGISPDRKRDRTARVQALRESHEARACFAERRVLRNTLIPVPKLPSRFYQACCRTPHKRKLGKSTAVVCEAEGALPLSYVAFILAIFRFLRQPHEQQRPDDLR